MAVSGLHMPNSDRDWLMYDSGQKVHPLEVRVHFEVRPQLQKGHILKGFI